MVKPGILIKSVAVTCLLLASCEEVIHPELEPAAPVLVVEAWLNNKTGTQEISLSWTQPYFDSGVPPGVSGATVTLYNLTTGQIFDFLEAAGSGGKYHWTPSVGTNVGEAGDELELVIQ